MSLKTILPWVLAVVVCAGALWMMRSAAELKTSAASLRANITDLEPVRARNTELKEQRAQSDDLARMRNDNETMPKLKEDIEKLRAEKAVLAAQVQSTLSVVSAAQQAAVEARAAAVVANPGSAPAGPEADRLRIMGELNTLKQIALASIMFAEKNGGTFPTSMESLRSFLPQNLSDPSQLAQFELIPLPAGGNFNPAVTPIARGRTPDTAGRRSYVYADGHAEARRDSPPAPPKP